MNRHKPLIRGSQPLSLLIMLAFGLLATIPAQAQTGNWQGEYFSNESLSGEPALVRDDDAIVFNWGDDSPAPGVIDADDFSVRWTRSLDLPAGVYRFTLSTDDGARLWVNDRLLIDQWQTQPLTTYNADLSLQGGSTLIRLEYFERSGGALVDFSWTTLRGAPPQASPGAPANVWRGEYFYDVNFGSSADLVRFDPELNFDWGDGSPAPGRFDPDRFSVRWSRTLNLAPGSYQFSAHVDDGVRVWVDGQLIIDDWDILSARTLVGAVDVSGGATPVVVEYFENTEGAQIQLTWREVDAAASAP